uniref:PDZ and LIM domain protein 2 n=1 Tax=Sinocyclocheilus grahami TaxID=75366 RepID=A0A672K9U1_SINGR
MPFTVNLIGPSPWGFRISGGRDFKKAITVSKVNAGSKAETASLQLGDIIMEINGLNTGEMLNVEAQNKIKSCTTLQLLVESLLQNLLEFNTSSEMSHDLHLLKLNISLFFSLQLHSWSSEEKSIQSHRLSRPLSQEISSVDFRSNSVSSRTPTPPGRYSPHSPIEREVPISPRRSSDFAMQRFDRDSEVYKMIQENKESRAAPRQSNTFKMLQEVLEADEKEAAIRFPSKLSPSPSKTTSSVSGVQKYHTCEKCGTSIVTQAVRITDDRFRHPDCYTCTECGLNLKMRGHFWVEDKMYCEKHARERYQGTGSNYRYVVSPNH